jgi:hypothetical protein
MEREPTIDACGLLGDKSEGGAFVHVSGHSEAIDGSMIEARDGKAGEDGCRREAAKGVEDGNGGRWSERCDGRQDAIERFGFGDHLFGE